MLVCILGADLFQDLVCNVHCSKAIQHCNRGLCAVLYCICKSFQFHLYRITLRNHRVSDRDGFFSRKSMPIYASFWKRRILRIFFIEMRLLVRLATHPLSNSIRTLAISGVSLITDTPFAEIDFTLLFTRLSIISMSWIMRSRITLTS